MKKTDMSTTQLLALARSCYRIFCQQRARNRALREINTIDENRTALGRLFLIEAHYADVVRAIDAAKKRAPCRMRDPMLDRPLRSL